MARSAHIALLIVALAGTFVGALGTAGSSRADDPWPAIALSVVANGFTQPLRVVSPEDGTGRLFVVEQAGVIRIIDAAGNVVPEPFLSIPEKVQDASNEQGLLGLAFPPDFETSRRFYINYIRGTGSGETVVARLKARVGNLNKANKKSLQVLWTLAQPASNHNGGHMVFGPDGQLWIASGDGGGSPGTRPQSNSSLFGKILRASVTTFSGPFTPTWWAKGLRNPWTFSFDPLTNDLFVADVGQNSWEEVNFVPAGTAAQTVNFGWPIMEGAHCYNPATGCNQSGLRLPVTEYAHGEPCRSITGGSVYRGDDVPDLEGIYVFADYCTGQIFGLRPDGDDAGSAWDVQLLLDSGLTFGITAFGVDEDGEILVVYRGGTIYRVTAPPG